MKFLIKLSDYIQKSKRYEFLVFLSIVSIFACFTIFLYTPVCSIVDPYFHLNRILVLMTAFREGAFPSYIDYNILGDSGYFVKAFYPDTLLIPYAYIGNLTSIDFAYKLYIFSTTVFTAVCFYVPVRKFTKSYLIAFLGSFLYAFSFYGLFLLFFCGGLPSAMCIAFLPLAFWGLFELLRGDYKKWYILSIGFTLIINSHLITAILTVCVLLVFTLFYYKSLIKQPVRLVYLCLSALFCLVFSSYYLLPMIEQLLSNSFYVQTNPFLDISTTGLTFIGLFSLLLTNSYDSDFSDFYGKIGLLLTFAVCLRFFVPSKTSLIKYADIAVLSGIVFIVLCTSYIPWTVFPFNLFQFIQFPWRLLIFTNLFFCFAGSIYISTLLTSKRKKILFFFSFLFLIAVLLKMNSNVYHRVISYNCNSVLDEEVIKDNVRPSGLEYLPSKVPSREYILSRGHIVLAADSTTKVTSFEREGKLFRLNLELLRKDTLELPLTYYKGYRALYAGDMLSLPVSQSSNGLIEIPVNRSGNIIVWYEGTLLQKISSVISILGVILLCIYIFFSNRKKKIYESN